MTAREGESVTDQIRALRSWRDDAARELRELERKVKAMAATLDRHEKQLGNLARTQDIADAVTKAMQGERRRRLEWWHVVLAIVALTPAYVTLVVLLAGLGR